MKYPSLVCFAVLLAAMAASGCGRSSLLLADGSDSSSLSGGGFGGQGGDGGFGGFGGQGGDGAFGGFGGQGGDGGFGGQGGCGPVLELCDGVDNDCDGAIDEGNPGGGFGCPTGLPGLCSTGTTACQGGTLQCIPNVTPSVEACNSLDDDCDGATDEGNPGGGLGCVTGLPGICSAGTTACQGGTLKCIPNMMLPEACNAQDDDCDGAIDEGNPGGGGPCSTGLPGICNAGTITCTFGMLSCVQNLMPSPEACNNLDDDCDGAIDEGNPGGGLNCNTGLPGICSIGMTTCQSGMTVCIQIVMPSTEVCNSVDDDCDGAIDEGNPGGGAACSTGLPGPCSAGTITCQNGMLSCIPNAAPSPEKCNGIDDNCNGAIDEGNPGGGGPCSTGLPGVCGAGTITCQSGMLSCLQNVMPSPETCNGLDDDCDGAVDDGLSFCQCTMATFGNHTYAFCPQPSTWNAALAVCTGGGFHLVSINGAAENNFVFNTANTISNEKWWIGLNDIAQEGNFVWQDGSPVTYTNWEPGEPNNSGNEDCGQINRFFPKTTWNDEPCSFQLFFICESP